MTRSRALGRVTLRAATEADEPLLRELATDRLAPTSLDETSLDGEQRRALIEIQLRAQRREYLARFPDAEDSIVLVDGTPIGRLWLGESDEEVRVLDISILPEHRGRGIGTVVLRDVFVAADDAVKPVRLTVRRDRPRTVAFYRKLGFTVVNEDALDLILERPAAPDRSTSPPGKRKVAG
jgi:ribosomal protein S18 acetylase RimI-like enzyme